MEKLATEVRQAFSGTRSAAAEPVQAGAATSTSARTIRANLAHYQPGERRLVHRDAALLLPRTRRHLDQWQVILLVDQSGSMAGSVIHSAVTAACLWGLPGVQDAPGRVRHRAWST